VRRWGRLAVVGVVVVVVALRLLLALLNPLWTNDDEDASDRFAAGTVLGSVLRPVEAHARESLNTDVCADRCGILRGGETAWIGEPRRAAILRRDGDRWQPVLEALDPGTRRFASIRAHTIDLDGDGVDEVVFGFRARQGSAGILQLDVVSAEGVVLHRDLDKGSASVGNGELETWEARFGPEDPNCCPSTFVHAVVGYRDGEWGDLRREDVPAEAARPDDF
jgi:hypothetical protein